MTPGALLEEAVGLGHPPAASACAIVDGRVVHQSAHGAEPSSVFDVASVTKVAATTLSVAKLIARGELSLDAPVARWLPRFAANGKDRVTVRELLGHRSGMPAWAPLFVEVMEIRADGRALRAGRLAESGNVGARPPADACSSCLDAPLEKPGRRVYSDFGFITLGALVEEVAGTRLDAVARGAVFEPLGLEEELGFVVLSAPSRWMDGRHVLPTGRTRPREPAPGQESLYRVPPQERRDDVGRVDDDNAFAMGGVAGHAGVFGTARASASLGWLVIEELEGAARLGSGEVLRSFVPIDPADGPPRSLGFDRVAPEGSSAGSQLGRGPKGAIGHLGFTGCSLWIRSGPPPLGRALDEPDLSRPPERPGDPRLAPRFPRRALPQSRLSARPAPVSWRSTRRKATTVPGWRSGCARSAMLSR